MRAPAPPRRVGLDRAEAREVGSVAHDEDVLGIHPAALDGDAGVGPVGGQRHVGHPVGHALGAQRRAVAEVLAAPEARAVELGHEVVVVEDEARALAAQAARGQQQDVGRVAGVHDVESPLAREPAHQPAKAPQGLRVLARVAERCCRRGAADSGGSRCPRAPRRARCRARRPGRRRSTTSQPAAASVRLMFHTRRSAGTGAFSLIDQDAAGAHQAAPRPRRRPGRCAPGSCTFSHSDRRRAYSTSSAIISSSVQLRAAADLPEAGHPGLDREALEPVRRVVLDLVGDRRARADERHVAAQHVPQLRQLVEARLAQEAPDARDARVVGHLEEVRARGVSPAPLAPAIRPTTNSRWVSCPAPLCIVRNLLTVNGSRSRPTRRWRKIDAARRVQPDGDRDHEEERARARAAGRRRPPRPAPGSRRRVPRLPRRRRGACASRGCRLPCCSRSCRINVPTGLRSRTGNE